MRALLLTTVLCTIGFVVQAADLTPEIRREAAKAQAPGVVHTLRTIPEACARLEGAFAPDAAQPYKFAVVRTSPTCQPRAKFVDAAKANPSEAAGWKFNDLIRVPNANCPDQIAEVRVWRKPVGVKPKLDAQGQARVYLQDAKNQADTDKLAAVGMFAAQLSVVGKSCGH